MWKTYKAFIEINSKKKKGNNLIKIGQWNWVDIFPKKIQTDKDVYLFNYNSNDDVFIHNSCIHFKYLLQY